MSKKTIQLNQEFLKPSSSNSNSIGGGGGNKTLKNRERKEKPNLVIKPNNLKKQLLQKIKNYQNKDELVQNKAAAVGPPIVSFDIENNNKALENIDGEENNNFGDEFNKSLNFLQNLSVQKNNNNHNNNHQNNNKVKNKTIKKKADKKFNNANTQIATELPAELCIDTIMPMSNTIPASIMPIMPMMPMMSAIPNNPIIQKQDFSENQIEIVVEPTNNNNNNNNSSHLVLKEPPMYSNLKNGSKPTYRQVHNKTQKKTNFNIQMPIAQAPPLQIAPIAQASIAQAPIAQITPPSSTNVNEPIVVMANVNEDPSLSASSALPSIEPNDILKRKITRTLKYKLGKRGNRVSVLIKNGKTRKLIQHEQALLKKKSILDVKNYLRKKNLLKIGSEAPPDILRQIYENSILAGDLNNKSKETLIHNFMNDK